MPKYVQKPQKRVSPSAKLEIASSSRWWIPVVGLYEEHDVSGSFFFMCVLLPDHSKIAHESKVHFTLWIKEFFIGMLPKEPHVSKVVQCR